MAHVLIVGGTGLLKRVSLFLAQHSNTVSVIARHRESLDQLASEAGELSDRINPIELDYQNIKQLQKQLKASVRKHGPIMLAVTWVHEDAPETRDTIAGFLNRTSPVCRYFHVQGSTTDPQPIADAYKNMLARYQKVLYRRIILGFEVEKGFTRWLTEEEVGNGVIEAIRSDSREAVIGFPDPTEHSQTA